MSPFYLEHETSTYHEVACHSCGRIQVAGRKHAREVQIPSPWRFSELLLEIAIFHVGISIGPV